MTPIRIQIAQWKCRLLRACSKSYREHETVVFDRDHWRRECVVEGNNSSELRSKLRESEADIAELRDRLKLAIAAQENATQQLIAERALRHAADERADRYHGELTDSLKSAANWSTKALNRKSMFSEVDAPETEPTSETKHEAIRSKPMARNVAAQQTHSELEAMLKSIREGEIHVGPEFTTQ